LTACVSGSPAPFPLIPFAWSSCLLASKLSGLSPSFWSAALGVGHWRIASVRVVPLCITPVVVVCLPADALSRVLAVGQNEDPLSSVGRTNVGRSKTHPLRIEPEIGQTSKESSNPIPGNEASDVLHEDEARSHLANDPQELVDEVSLVVAAPLLSCRGVRLARDAAKDEIHQSSIAMAVEPTNVAVNRRCAQGLRFHPFQEDGLGVGFPLNVGHRTGSEDSLDCEVKTADA
jgi:hypothetical protein